MHTRTHAHLKYQSLTIAASARVARGHDDAVAERAELLRLGVDALLVVLAGLVLALVAVRDRVSKN